MKPKNIIRKVTLFLLLIIPSWLVSMEPGDKVENFRLLDQKGGSHELFYYNDQKVRLRDEIV